jgi:hypothetical protein
MYIYNAAQRLRTGMLEAGHAAAGSARLEAGRAFLPGFLLPAAMMRLPDDLFSKANSYA